MMSDIEAHKRMDAERDASPVVRDLIGDQFVESKGGAAVPRRFKRVPRTHGLIQAQPD